MRMSTTVSSYPTAMRFQSTVAEVEEWTQDPSIEPPPIPEYLLQPKPLKNPLEGFQFELPNEFEFPEPPSILKKPTTEDISQFEKPYTILTVGEPPQFLRIVRDEAKELSDLQLNWEIDCRDRYLRRNRRMIRTRKFKNNGGLRKNLRNALSKVRTQNLVLKDEMAWREVAARRGLMGDVYGIEELVQREKARMQDASNFEQPKEKDHNLNDKVYSYPPDAEPAVYDATGFDRVH